MIMKLASLALSLALSSLLAEQTRIPGTKVTLNAPAGFAPAKQFPGFMMEETGASIMVTALEGAPFKEISRSFNREGLASQGMALIERKETKVGETPAFLIHARQQVNGTSFLKWMLAFGGSSETNLVVATIPEQFKERLSEPLKKAVLSSSWDPSLVLDLFDGLTFRVSESDSLKLAKAIGNQVILTLQGVFPQQDPEDPMVIVGASVTERWIVPGSKKDFSINRLAQTQGLENPTIISQKSVRIDTLEGYLIRAQAVDRELKKERYIEQCLLFTNDGYYIVQGFAAADERERFQPEFQRILQSFKRIQVDNK